MLDMKCRLSVNSGGSFEAYKIRPGFVLAGFEDMNYKQAV